VGGVVDVGGSFVVEEFEHPIAPTISEIPTTRIDFMHSPLRDQFTFLDAGHPSE
jgi:hypothetical protein